MCLSEQYMKNQLRTYSKPSFSTEYVFSNTNKALRLKMFNIISSPAFGHILVILHL